MGKSAVILVLFSIFAWTNNFSDRQQTFLETQDQQALYEERVLAREAALSGFDVVVGQTEEDFYSFRTELLKTPYKDGDFTVSAVEGAGDTMLVSSTGKVGRADYTIAADMIYKVRPKLAALNIDGPVSFTNGIGMSYGVHGQDTNPDDVEGFFSGEGGWANGIHSILKSADAEMQSGFDESLVTGGLYGRDGSFFQGPMDLDLDDLEKQIVQSTACSAVNNPKCIIYEGNQRFTGNYVFGSPEEPVTVIVKGDVTFRGSVQGYGVLYSTGNFATEVGQPRWEGLIYASTQGGDHELRGQPHIYGALILRSKNAAGATAQSGEEEANLDPMTITVRGEPKIYYSTKALARLSVLVPMLAFDPPEGFLLNIRQASSERTDLDLTTGGQETSEPSNVF